MSKVAESAAAAEMALYALLSEGAKVSQHAVEKRAGLANGALNYNHPLYVQIKCKITNIKDMSHPKNLSSQNVNSKSTQELLDAKRLKNKYKCQRDLLIEQLRTCEGERLELCYQLFHVQKYLKFLEENGLADSNVFSFFSKKNYGDK